MEHTLTIHTSHDLVQVTLYDNRDEVVYRELGRRHELSLKKGIYTVRAELSGQLKEETILLRDQSEVINLPLEYFSSAPLKTSPLKEKEKVIVTSHEYYTDGIAPLLKSAKNKDRDNSQLLVLFRYSSKERYQKYNPTNSWGLKDDAEQGPLTKLPQNLILFTRNIEESFVYVSEQSEWKMDTWGGSLAYCQYMPSGLYYLGYSGELGGKSRLLPLYLFNGWTTLVFITLGSEPLFSSMRVMMTKLGRDFDPSDNELFAVDYAADQFQNNQYALTEEVGRTLIHQKFENPILGILFAYSALLGNDRRQDGLVQQVLRNLEYNIISHADWPDIEVLKLIASRRFNRAYESQPFEKPPLLRVGMEWLINAAIEQPELLPERSLICQLSPNVLADNVWTSWQVAPDLLKSLLPGQDDRGSEPLAMHRKSVAINLNPEVSWAEVGLMQIAEQQLGTQQMGEGLNLQKLAAGVGLPVNAVRSIIKKLSEDQTYCQQVLTTLKEHQSVKTDDSVMVNAIYELNEK